MLRMGMETRILTFLGLGLSDKEEPRYIYTFKCIPYSVTIGPKFITKIRMSTPTYLVIKKKKHPHILWWAVPMPYFFCNALHNIIDLFIFKLWLVVQVMFVQSPWKWKRTDHAFLLSAPPFLYPHGKRLFFFFLVDSQKIKPKNCFFLLENCPHHKYGELEHFLFLFHCMCITQLLANGQNFHFIQMSYLLTLFLYTKIMYRLSACFIN